MSVVPLGNQVSGSGVVRVARAARRAASVVRPGSCRGPERLQAGQADHPFWKSLRRTLGASDPQLAAFAKGLDSTLSQKVAEAKAPRPSDTGTPVQMVAPAGGASSPPSRGGSSPESSRTAETRPGG